jgi:PAS domain-containing protein
MELNYVKNSNNLPGILNCGLFICDTSGKLLNCNETFFHKLGYSNKTEIQINLNGVFYEKLNHEQNIIHHIVNTRNYYLS